MENAREELEHVLRVVGVGMAAAHFRMVHHAHDGVAGPARCGDDDEVTLPLGYTSDEREECLRWLDFEYDDGFGGQYLDGTIWLADGTWVERLEYDGSERWRHVERPPLPIREVSDG